MRTAARWRGFLLPLALAALVLSALITYLTAPGAMAQDGEGPRRCRVGGYVTSLHDFDLAENSFGADFWLWSICPTPDRKPLETMEFANADEVSTRLEETLQLGDRTWTILKVRGTFRHDWNEQNYPFDRQSLAIVLEEGEEEASAFGYEADRSNSSYDATIDMPGWRITGFTLTADLASYATNFGDPTLPEGGASEYSRLTFSFDIVRTELNSFFEMTAVVYVAFALSLITYIMYLETGTTLGAQIGLLSGAIFATGVNWLKASADLQDPGNLTLVDKIHIVVLLYILAATVIAVASRLLLERGWTKQGVARLNYRVFGIAALSFIAVNVALVGLAVRAE